MVFAFLYDPFWALTRTPKFDAFLNAVVGRNYQTSLIFWANHVPALHGASGFSPHKDGRSYGKSTVTCWVPLTPATPDNGCMYVVDTNDATRSLLDTFDSLETLSKRQVSVLMANIRALPIDPGGFLAWRHDVIHWGGRYRCGTQDRLALSWEIISDDYENTDADLHAALRHDRPLPRFDLRLKWICQAFLQFAGREPILGRFVPLANAILHR
jgi:ectoine hydroxylase-related dioxygenase (phytanoyl-CoA dioxygenase family)